MSTSFTDDLKNIINRHSIENFSDTPDFILAKYLNECLIAFDVATHTRTEWYKKSDPQLPSPPQPVLTLDDVRLEIKKYISEHSEPCEAGHDRNDDCDIQEERDDRQCVVDAIRMDRTFYTWFMQALNYQKKGSPTKVNSLIRRMYERLEEKHGVVL